MSASINSTNFNMAIQRALSAEPIAGRPFPFNRHYRRAMRKHRKGMTGPLAVGPRPVASGGVSRRRSGISRTGPSESASSWGGVPAPTFNLKLVHGEDRVQLNSFRGVKPVVLIFGSYT